MELKKKSLLFLLFLVGLLAFTLRFYKFTKVPPSLNWDEVSIGYNAYSILKTGRDEWGEFLPLHFKSYGEYKLPAQIYASIPAIAIFGLNPFSVRITPVIYGTLTVFLLYFLVCELFRRKGVALISSFLLAISPWHIQLTRASFESSFSVFWVIMGMWFLVKGFKDKRWLVISMIPFAISVYTYNSARVFTPLFLMTIGIIYLRDFIRNNKSKRYFVISALLFGVLMAPLVPFVLSGEASARYKLVSITNEAGLIPRINERRGMSELPTPLPRLIHNKVTYISYYFARNYLAHFTPDFLFIHGAGHRQHHVQGMGELYKFQAPFLVLGLYLILRRKEKYRWLLLTWLFLAFVPVAMTKDSIPNALRTLIANPVYQVITAYGLVLSYGWLRRRKLEYARMLIGLLVVFGLLEFLTYLDNYFNVYPKKYSRDWQYGYKQAVAYVKDHYDNYDLIVFSRVYGEPHMFTLFYMEYPLEKYMYNPNLVRYKAHDWVWVTRFDKFYFPNLSDKDSNYEDILKENKGKRVLFIGKPSDFGDDVNILKNIDFLDGSSAFSIVEKNG